VSSVISDIERFIGKKFAIFRRFCPPQSRLKSLQGVFAWDLWYESWRHKTRSLRYLAVKTA